MASSSSRCRTRPASRRSPRLKNRALRERIMETSLAGTATAAISIIARSSRASRKLRAERATLLGYPNHAAYQLEDQTAGNVATVNKMLGRARPAGGGQCAQGSRRHADDHRSRKKGGDSSSRRGIGISIPRKCARSATPSMNRSCALLRTESRAPRRRLLRRRQSSTASPSRNATTCRSISPTCASSRSSTRTASRSRFSSPITMRGPRSAAAPG